MLATLSRWRPRVQIPSGPQLRPHIFGCGAFFVAPQGSWPRKRAVLTVRAGAGTQAAGPGAGRAARPRGGDPCRSPPQPLCRPPRTLTRPARTALPARPPRGPSRASRAHRPPVRATRPAPCSAPTSRRPSARAIGPGGARSAGGCGGWRRPARPHVTKVPPPDDQGRPHAGAGGARVEGERSGRLERRSPIVQPPPGGQDGRHVTGVTERVSEGVHFNRPIQPINLICAIALPPEATGEFPGEPSPARVPASPTPPAESSGRPVRDRSAQVRGVRREEPEVIRKRRRAGLGGSRAQKDRAGPGGVQRDQNDLPVGYGGRGPLGRTTASCGAMGCCARP